MSVPIDSYGRAAAAYMRAARGEPASETSAGSERSFAEMVKDGRMPSPKVIGRRKIWDRCKLDLAFEALPEDGASDANPWDEVA